MSCASDQAGSAVPPSGPVVDKAGSSGRDQSVSALAESDHGSYSCSCGSCYSVSPVTISFALIPATAPEAILSSAPLFESVVRQPLVPPPQLVS